MAIEKKNKGGYVVGQGFIKGIPFTKPTNKSERSLEGCRNWQEEIKKQTIKYEGKVKGPCRLRVVFHLPEGKYNAANANYGPDIDNLAKAFLDAFKETVFKALECDGDACVMSLHLSKIKVSSEEDAGAHFHISLTEEHKIEKVEEVTPADLGIPHWKEPMQKITTDTGVYLDNLPGVSHTKNAPPGYDWKQEEGKVVFGAEVRESNGYLWLNKEAK